MEYKRGEIMKNMKELPVCEPLDPCVPYTPPNCKGGNMKKKATVEDIKNLVKVLKKHKVKGPYYLKMENPKECFDLLGVKPIKGDVINLDTVRKGVKFLHNETKKNLEKDFGVKKTI